jgi:hypothetical protein
MSDKTPVKETFWAHRRVIHSVRQWPAEEGTYLLCKWKHDETNVSRIDVLHVWGHECILFDEYSIRCDVGTCPLDCTCHDDYVNAGWQVCSLHSVEYGQVIWDSEYGTLGTASAELFGDAPEVGRLVVARDLDELREKCIAFAGYPAGGGEFDTSNDLVVGENYIFVYDKAPEPSAFLKT